MTINFERHGKLYASIHEHEMEQVLLSLQRGLETIARKASEGTLQWPDNGICMNLDFIGVSRKARFLANWIMATWPYHSGEASYPVEGSAVVYDRDHSKWDVSTHNGHRRLQLLQYMIDTTEELLTAYRSDPNGSVEILPQV